MTTPPAVVFLGVAAVAAFVQALALIVLGLELRRTFVRVDALGVRVTTELRPAVSHLGEATARVARASEVSLAQAKQLDALTTEASHTLRQAADILERVILPYAVRMVSVATAMKTLRKGLTFYRRLRGR